jgi:hypothetical protein
VRASFSAAGIQSLGDKAKTGSPEHEPSSSISEWKNGRRPVDHRIHHDAHDLEVTKIQETKGGLEILIQIHKGEAAGRNTQGDGLVELSRHAAPGRSPKRHFANSRCTSLATRGQSEKGREQFVPDFAVNNAIIKFASGARTTHRTQFFVVLNSQAVHQMLAFWVLTRGALVGKGPTRKSNGTPHKRFENKRALTIPTIHEMVRKRL